MRAALSGRRVGPFEVEDLVGAGGMGEVYRARDTRLGRSVALKVLPAEVAGDPERLARFEREARLVAALSHPNILTLYEVGSQGGITYAAFELLEGETLRKRLAPGPLAVRRAVEIAALVARGLAAAHARGIVHRDLKPDNLFLARDGGVKILDFGLARQEEGAWPAWSQDATKDPLTDAGTVLGTVGYMSPEQVRGEEAGPRSDLFALGCVLYEMLGGRRPFAGASRAETLAAVLHQEPTPLPALGTHPGVDRLMRRCLEKDPARRFQSADDLAFALEGLLSSPSGSGELPGGGPRPGARASRWSRGTAVIAGLALLAGGLAGRALTPAAAPAPSFERVSFRRGSVFQARFTPDGRGVLYSAAFEGGPPEVYETRLGNPDSRALGLAPASLLAVSPSGEIAVVRQPSLLLSYHHPGRLAVLSSAGATPRDVAELVSAADWTPDGRELVVVRRASANEFPSRALLEWPSGVTLYETPNITSSLRVSPRGDRVAFFEHGLTQAAELVTVDRKGSRASLGGGWDRTTGGLAWRPDGRSLWVTVVDEDQASPHPRLIEVGLDTSRRVVLELPGGVRLHDVSADGRVLVSQPNMRVSLHVGGLPSERDKDLSWFGSSVINDLSPDGSRVLFTDRPSPSVTRHALFLRPRDGGPAVRLVDGVSAFGGQLSPDGRWVAATRGQEGPLRLDSTGTGAAPELPPSGFRQNVRWAWLPDTTGLVVAGIRDDGAVGLVELGLSGAAPRPLAGACPGHDVVISPDGRRVACGNHPFLGTAVFIHARDGSGSRQLTTSAPAGTLLRWSADGRSLFSHRQGELPAAILRTDLATGRVEVVRTVMPPDPTGVWGVRLGAVTADGRAWAYSALSWLGDLYVYSGLR